MKLVLDVLSGEHRPVAVYNEMLFLFDSGATTPVWCAGLPAFKAKYADAQRMKYKFILSGFGRSEAEIYDFLLNTDSHKAKEFLSEVYSIPQFVLETNGNSIMWENLNVAVTNRVFGGVHMILPYTMFGGMTLSFVQDIYHAKISIKSDKAVKSMFVNLERKYNPKLLKYIYSQDDAIS